MRSRLPTAVPAKLLSGPLITGWRCVIGATRDSATLAAVALDRINAAFAERMSPSELTASMQLSDSEQAEVMSFEGLRWQDVTFDQVQRCADAVFWFSPEAFVYFLPGILAAGLREARSDANAYDSLVGMLDRSPEPEHWDDFFVPRWSSLSAGEIDGVAAWLDWLQGVEPDEVFTGTYRRARDTLALLQMLAEEQGRLS